MTQQHFNTTFAGNPPANYERFFVPAIGAPLAADLIRRAALRSGERVLDVACGTGVVARLAAQQVGVSGAVAGLDINPGMLAVARASAKPGPSIAWHEASAESMPFPDAAFDVVFSQMGLQFVPDKERALREMQRVLVRGGRLLINLPGPAPHPLMLMEASLKRYVGAEAAGFVNRVFSLHDEKEVQDLVSGAGFHDITVSSEIKSLNLPAPEEFFWGYVHSTPLAMAVAEVDDEQRDALEREVVSQWQEEVQDGTFRLPTRVVTAMARKA